MNHVNYIAEKLTIHTNSKSYFTVCTHYKTCSLGTIRHGHLGPEESQRSQSTQNTVCTLCQRSMNHVFGF